VYCPKCNYQLQDGSTDCCVCGWELSEPGPVGWVLVGTVDGDVFANLAREILKASGIPAVVISKSGFFGNIGLTLTPFFSAGKSWDYELSVPTAHSQEAADILSATLGEKWNGAGS